MRPARAQIDDVVMGILTNEDERWTLDLSRIRPDARLFQDIGLDSIDILHVIASIQQDLKLRQGAPFQELLVKDGTPVDVTVKQVIDFVDENFDRFNKAPEPSV
jgi:acyl carrier protein